MQRLLRRRSRCSGKTQLGIAQALPPAQERGEEEGDCGCCVDRRGTGSWRCAHEVQARQLMSWSEVPPHGIKSFESFASAGPNAEGESQARNEACPCDPG